MQLITDKKINIIQSLKQGGESTKTVGVVLSVIDGVATIFGLTNVKAGEMLIFPTISGISLTGMALNLNRYSVGAVLFGDEYLIRPGGIVNGTGTVMEVPTGFGLLGRVVNGVGVPIDGKGILKDVRYVPVEIKAPGIMPRGPVIDPMLTGVKSVDSLLPIGRGQRELIIGDRQTGKTSLCLDAILNQKSENLRQPKKKLYCIYNSIGQKCSSVSQISSLFNSLGRFEYSVIVSATAAEAAPLQYLSPFTSCAIAEFFRDNGAHALVIFDDLSKQAIAYRQMSLLLKRPPGREAYPGDVFYLHSRLLERAAKLNEKFGSGSLTALPVVETQTGDVSAYIVTNVISITDGQIFLDSHLFYNGVRPAVNIGLSVSRIGSAAQLRSIKNITSSLKIELAQYREALSFAQFGSNLDPATVKMISHGGKLTRLLIQPRFDPISIALQAMLFYMGLCHFLESIPESQLSQ